MSLPAPWTFVLCLVSGTEIGEILNATERQLQLAMKRPSTASFTVRADNPLLPSIFANNVQLKVYQGTTLRFRGDILTPEAQGTDGESPTVKVTAADPAWVLARRLANQSASTQQPITMSGDKATNADKLIEETNGANNTFIETGKGYTSGSTGTYSVEPYKPVLTCINDLANGAGDGFDWRIEPLTGSSTKGYFHAAALFGEEKANTFFELGTGLKNVRGWSYIKDMTTLTNHAVHLPEGFGEENEKGEYPEVIDQLDVPSQAAYGRFEEVADAPDLSDKGIREAWVNEVVTIKRYPRRVLALTSDIDDGTGRVPVVGTDYWIGDFVQTRGVLGQTDTAPGVTLWNGKARVYQINVALNDTGTATATPVLIDEGNNL